MIDRLREAAQALVDDAGTPDRFDPMTSTFVHDAQLQALREALVATEPAVMRESAAMRHAAADLHCATARLDKLLAEPVVPAGVVHDEASAFERGAVAGVTAVVDGDILWEHVAHSEWWEVEDDDGEPEEIALRDLLVKLDVLPDTATPEPSAADLLALLRDYRLCGERCSLALHASGWELCGQTVAIRSGEAARDGESEAAALMRVLGEMAPDDGAGEMAGREVDGRGWR